VERNELAYVLRAPLVIDAEQRPAIAQATYVAGDGVTGVARLADLHHRRAGLGEQARHGGLAGLQLLAQLVGRGHAPQPE